MRRPPSSESRFPIKVDAALGISTYSTSPSLSPRRAASEPYGAPRNRAGTGRDATVVRFAAASSYVRTRPGASAMGPCAAAHASPSRGSWRHGRAGGTSNGNACSARYRAASSAAPPQNHASRRPTAT